MIFVTLALLAALVEPDPLPLDLYWEAPELCPTEEEVRAQLEQLVVAEVGQGAELRVVEAHALVFSNSGGFELTLRLRTTAGEGVRTAHAQDCGVLAETAALLVSFAAAPRPASSKQADPSAQQWPSLDPVIPQEPVVTVGRSLPEPASAPPVAESSPVEEDEALVPAVTHRRRSLVLDLGGAGVVGYGGVPTVDLGVFVLAALHARRWRAEAGGGHIFAQEHAWDARDDAGVSVSAWIAKFYGCYVPSHRAWSFPLCGAAWGGAMLARGYGIDHPKSAAHPWLLGGAELRVQYRAPHIALWLAGAGMLALTRPRFSLGGEEAFGALPALFQASLGLAWSIPLTKK